MTNQLEEYKKAAGMMPGSVLIFQLEDDETMKVFFYSQKAQEITGMEAEKVDDTIFPNGFHMIVESDQKVIVEKVKYAIDHKEELDVVYRQHHKIRGVVWIHMKAAIVGNIDDKPTFIATMLDVTNEMLNSSSIMEAADSSICVIEKQTKLLLYGNSKFYKLIDRKPSESMGVYCYDILCGNPAFRTDNQCLCFSTINIEKPLEYYNPDTKQYLSMYGRNIMWGEHEAYVFYLTDQTEEKFKEKQLKNAQERFEMTLDNSDLYIWEYDIINSQCINPQKAVREYGLPPVIDNYPETLFELGHTPPETIAQIKDVKRRLLNGETGFSVERKTIDGKGKPQWMKVSYTLEKDASGRPVRALVCGTDITEQKKKEFAYEEEIRLKKTVTSDTRVLAILNLTKNCVAENDAHNPVLAQFLELGSADEIMNAVCDEFIIPSDRENYRRHFSRERMLADYERGIMRGTFRHQFTCYPGWFESAYDLIVNPSTGDVEAITTMKDVTDEVRSKQVINKLTSIDYDTIMTIDVENGEIYKFDRGNISGVDAGEKLDSQEYSELVARIAKKYCASEEADRVIRETGKEYVLEKLKTLPIYTTTFLMTIDGKTIRKRNVYTYLDPSHKTVLCASQDITESYQQEEKQRKALADALERAEVANRAKTMFLSRVSHDMRTPLNGVLGLTALMRDEVTAPEVLEDLKKLELSGKYLLDLINDVLDVSSIESGKLELHPTICEGGDVFDKIIKLAKPNMDARNIRLVILADQLALVPTWIDESRIQQVAMNILGNAAKFTPEGGVVEFGCRTLSADEKEIINEFLIRDNGIGMDEDFLPHMFEPFSQENAAITNSKNGTGLGLSISKKIIELMHGSIQVESKKGVGTTVRVILHFPVATEEQIRQSRETVKPQTSDDYLRGKRILLCEDHPLNMEIARRVLEKVGAIVDHAENGKIGVEMFEASPEHYYDAILMDIRMPVMDGLEATGCIRSLKRADAATVPILAMTANALSEDARNTAAVGMNAHLSKPFNPEELYETIAKYLN